MLRIFVVFLLGFVCVKGRDSQDSIVRIYSNLAEIIQPFDKLPLEFTNEDWSHIRSDSITLVGKDLNVTSQRITEKKTSLNGAQVYIRSPIVGDKSAVMFAKATIVDENRYLVKMQDQSIAGQEALYFTVHPQDIFYLNEPVDSKFYVDFTYTTADSEVYVSYLRTNIKWQTQYQLNLHHDKRDLIVMVNIRNDGKSSLFINKAELLGGDINLRAQSQQYYARSAYMADASSRTMNSISSSELMGTHVFTIDKPFMVDGQTNYLLPMLRPKVKVGRYHSITKPFNSMLASSSSTGTAQRSYRLISDQYLTKGNCIIRESNRIVGETQLPEIAANNKHEFSIGQDAEITYTENVTLVSSEKFQEATTLDPTNPVFSTRAVYKIDVQIKNAKTRPIKVEYTQLFTYIYNTLKLELIKSNDNICTQENLSIKCNPVLNAGAEYFYSYTIESTSR